MRDLSFYQQVGHSQVEYRKQLFYMPVFYYEVTTLLVAFFSF